jgi:hypothetical protein
MDMPYRYYANRQPDSAAARKDMADVYRNLRSENKAWARFIYRRCLATEAELSKLVLQEFGLVGP